MNAFLHRLPIPVGCVALGLIGLAVLLGGVSTAFLWVFGTGSVLFQLAVLLKLCLPDERKAICTDLTALSTLAGTVMAMMLTAAQLKKLLSLAAAPVIWYAAVLFHLFILVLFSGKLLRERPGLAAVRGSWLLVYVGIAAVAISAPAFSANRIGLFLLIPSATGALILLPLVYRADLRSDSIPAAQRPLFCISAAPVSIWLAGYLSSCSSPSRMLVIVLLSVAQLLYFPALIRCIRLLRLPFAPAAAAFTFPFVITASALKQASSFLGLSDMLRIPIALETAAALLLCLYTVFLYLRFLLGPAAK